MHQGLASIPLHLVSANTQGISSTQPDSVRKNGIQFIKYKSYSLNMKHENTRVMNYEYVPQDVNSPS